MDITLTESQQKLHDEIIEAYKAQGNQHVLVTGSAGTGKSTSVFKALDTLVRENPNLRITFIAPTHNALGVVRRIGDHWETLANVIEFNTIASSLKMKPKRIGTKTVFVQSGDPDWSSHIVLIDESSMIDKEVFDLILDAGEFTPLTIFLGDKCQLPPVTSDPNVKESPIFGWDGFYGQTNLTEVVRYSGDVLKVADLVRLSMNVGYVDLLKITPENSETIEQIHMKEIKTEYAKSIAEGEFAKVLAFKNDSVNAINTTIHRFLGHNSFFVKDCKVVNLNPILLNNRQIPIETPLTINDVSEDRINLGVYDRELAHLDLDYTILSVTYYENSETTFNALNDVQIEEYNKTMRKIANLAKQTPKLWRAYYQIQDLYIPCRLPYATTIHKSQGNTYDKVILVLPDLAYCRDMVMYNKLLYTAFTRTSGKVLIATI